MDAIYSKSNNYLIKNRGKAYQDKKSFDELVKTSDILFADETVILHVSGNKDSAGKIMKCSQGLTKIFGYSKSEVTGHAINILMPSLFAKRHNEFLENFFQIGHKSVFNTERNFFGLHRNGLSFNMKMLVKQMPNLDEGIQYVGMICQTNSDYEIILTDMRGVIDSFSTGISSLLNLPISLFKECEVNIQILAPELINIFSSTGKTMQILEKFQETGGQKLTFYVPKDFAIKAQSEQKKNIKGISKITGEGPSPKSKRKRERSPVYRDFNKELNKHNGTTSKSSALNQLLQSNEYKDNEFKQTLKCEIHDLVFGKQYKDIGSLKMKIIKVFGISTNPMSFIDDWMSDLNGNMSNPHSLASENAKEIPQSRGNKDEIKKDLINMMNTTLKLIEDTKTTEKLPGNIATSESLVETVQNNQVILSKDTPEQKDQNDIIIPEKIGIINNSLAVETKKEEYLEVSTPRMAIGNLIGPELNRNNDHPEEIFSSSESHNITIKADFKKCEKEERRSLTKRANRKLTISENHLELAEEIGKINKANTNQERNSKKQKRGGSHNGRDDETFSGVLQENCKDSEGSKVSDDQKEEKVVALDQNQIDRLLKENGVKIPSLIDEQEMGSANKRIHEENKIRQINLIPTTTVAKKNQEKHDVIESQLSFASKTGNEIAKDKLNNISYQTCNMQMTKGESKNTKKSPKAKIVTNPFFDENGIKVEENFEYHPSNEEIKLRKSLLSLEKKKNREKKKKEKKVEVKKEESEDKDENDEENEVKKEEINENTKGLENSEDGEDNQDAQSSIASTTGGGLRSYYSLRQAIDEKYIPLSVRNLSCSAVVVILLMLSAACIL